MGDARRRKEFEVKMVETITRGKEVNPKMDLKIFFFGGVNIVGEVEELPKGTRLKKPRVLISGQDQRGRAVMGMQQLIGEPEEIEMYSPLFEYDVKDEKVINLYIQATTGIIPARDLSNVVPIKGGDGGGMLA